MADKNLLEGRTFLVVDDDISCVKMTTMILEGHGAAVYSATNGAEGLMLAQQLEPDMVLADLLMPQMDGWTLVKSLKGDPRLQHIPVIAVTASYLNFADMDHALVVGFAKIVPKPITISALLEAISIVSAL